MFYAEMQDGQKRVTDEAQQEPAWSDLAQTVRPLIDGEQSGGRDQPAELLDPCSGETFARIAYATADDIDRAIESASQALALWRSVPFAERRHILRRLAGLVRQEAWSLARLVTQEQGKPPLEAFQLEILPALDHMGFIIENAERHHAGLAIEPRHPFYAHKHSHYLYDAIGVIALVTPSPLPLASPLIRIAAALAMGNAVVLKPSERTPLCGVRIGELCLDAGFPAGLVNVVPALPEDTLHLVAHPKVDKTFLTGSIEAGQNVMVTAGVGLRPVVLCLGGKHPSVVAGDANIDRAARGVVWGALANAGQNCGSVERVYVEESIARRFIDRVLEEVDAVTVGNPLDEKVDMGPLQSAQRRWEVHRQVTEAAEAGARVLRGGTVPKGPGYFYPPTVVMGAPAGCRLMREETLGPVVSITVVDSIERAILLAGDGDYALTASAWTTSDQKAERLMVTLPAGVVTINDVLYSYGEPAATWSGYRHSGVGQNHGTPGLREMSRQRFVSYDDQPASAPLAAFPYDDEAEAIARASLDYLHGGGRFRRLWALGRLVRRKRFRSRAHMRWLVLPKKPRGK